MRELTTDEALKYIWKADTKKEKTSKYRAEIEAFLDSGAISAELDNPSSTGNVKVHSAITKRLQNKFAMKEISTLSFIAEAERKKSEEKR